MGGRASSRAYVTERASAREDARPPNAFLFVILSEAKDLPVGEPENSIRFTRDRYQINNGPQRAGAHQVWM